MPRKEQFDCEYVIIVINYFALLIGLFYVVFTNRYVLSTRPYIQLIGYVLVSSWS